MQTEKKQLDLELYTKEGKPRKRRRKKPNQEYFTKETDEAIVLYNVSDDPILRNKLFSEKIFPAFSKLAENNINGNGFEYAQEHAGGYEDLKHEVICKLMQEMPKFDREKGMKISEDRSEVKYTKGTLGFGYFNIITKRFLIQYNDKQYKLHKNRQDLESQEDEEKVDKIRHEGETDDNLQEFTQEFADWVEEGIDNWFYIIRDEKEEAIKFSESEKIIVRCIIKFFRAVEDLEIFWKPAFYLQIREETLQKTQDITRVVNILKEAFHEQLYEFHHRGELNIKKEGIFPNRYKDPTKLEEPDFEEYFT